MPIRLFLTETLLFSYLIFIYLIMQSPETGAFLPGLPPVGPFRAAVNILFYSCAAAGGMLVFAISGRVPSLSGRRVTAAAFALGVAGFLLMEASPGTSGLYAVALFFTMVSWGYLTGLISCRVATEVAAGWFGRFIGCAHGLAATIHFVLSTMDAGSAALPSVRAAALLSLCALGWLLFTGPPPALTAGKEEASPLWRKVFPEGLSLLFVGLVLVSLLQGFGDVLPVLRQDEYDPAFGWTRLFYAGGLFFFGWLADAHFFSLPVAMIFAKSYFFWYQLFRDERGIFPLFSCLDELLQSSFVVLLSAAFLHIAARSERPERWAATGRMVELPMMGVGLCAGLALQSRVTLSLMLAIYMTLLLLAIYTAYRFGLLYIRALRAEAAESGEAIRAIAAMEGAAFAAPLAAGVPAFVGMNAGAAMCDEAEADAMAGAEPSDTGDGPGDAYDEEPTEEEEEALASLGTDFWAGLRTENETFTSYCARYQLTGREADVLVELLRGRQAAEIAGALSITERTTRYHIHNILRKTEYHSQLALVSDLLHEITQEKNRKGAP